MSFHMGLRLASELTRHVDTAEKISQDLCGYSDIRNGIEVKTLRGMILRLVQVGDKIRVTEHPPGSEEQPRGTLIRLLGDQWLANPRMDPVLLLATGSKFADKWGAYWVIGERDGDYTVSRATYFSLLCQRQRLNRATVLERRDERFLLELADSAEAKFLEVDTDIRPFGEQQLQTAAELQQRGWSPDWCEECAEKHEPSTNDPAWRSALG